MSLFKRLTTISSCFLLMAACTSSHTKKSQVATPKPVEEVFYPSLEADATKDHPQVVFKLSLNSGSERVDTELINMIYSLVINKYFLSSQIFPEGAIHRKKIHTFSLDLSSSPQNVIIAELTKDDRYSSYKLVIQKMNPGKKDEKSRQWLFSSELSKEQAAVRVARTLVKYSFQNL